MNSQAIAFTPVDNKRLSNLCGALDENLKQIETALDVSIARRNEQFRITGTSQKIDLAITALQHFYNLCDQPLDIDEIQLDLIELTRSQDGEEVTAGPFLQLKTRRSDLRGRTPRQTGYIKAIQEHDITFGIGPAGTGKTYLAVACAVDALDRDFVKRLVLVRPAVEAGEKLGFLPGDLVQKVNPYLRPLYDALHDMMDYEKASGLLQRGAIEVAPLAFMRGRTLNDAFVILDEAQNTTSEQMKMFLTRLGLGSKAVITGDITQIDLPDNKPSGLVEAMQLLEGIRDIRFVFFSNIDVVRHRLVQEIILAYERMEQRRIQPAT